MTIAIRNLVRVSLIRSRWLSILQVENMEATMCLFAMRTASDLTLPPNFGSVSFVSSRINEAESQRTRKKGLFIWPTSPILIPTIIRKGSPPIGSYLLQIAKGFFSTRYTARLARALLILSRYARKPFTHARIRIRIPTCVCIASYSYRLRTKGRLKAPLSPFLTYRRRVLQ